MHKQLVIVISVFLAAAAPVAAQTTTAKAEEKKLVQELYGKRIAAALATSATEDNVTLGRELIAAANAVSYTHLRAHET